MWGSQLMVLLEMTVTLLVLGNMKTLIAQQQARAEGVALFPD